MIVVLGRLPLILLRLIINNCFLCETRVLNSEFDFFLKRDHFFSRITGLYNTKKIRFRIRI